MELALTERPDAAAPTTASPAAPAPVALEAGAAAGTEPAAQRVLEAVAQRLASCSLDAPPLDALGDAPIARQLATGFGNLGEAIRQAADMALSIGRALPRMAEDNDELSAQSEAQAEAVDGLLDGTATLRQALTGASEALHGLRSTAEQANQRASEGHAQSEQLAEAMRVAQGRAKRIHQVIEVIDMVAFQTHILSINAAVEAAHAGERGKGFAVVAAEVRTLADRAAQAAKEARAMVAEAEEALATGGARAQETGERLRELAALVQRAGSEMGGVADRVQAQGEALDAMEDTLARVAEMSRSNVEHAAEVAALSAAVRDNAEILTDCVRMFEVPADPLANPRHARALAIARQGAAAVGEALAMAVQTRRISTEALFSLNYVPIPDTEPTKFTTPFDALCDELLPPIQEPLAASEPWTVFAISANRDGYVPAHNLRFAQPLTGNRERDLVGNRTKRIFGDRVGRTVGRHTEPYKLQVYRRDTGEIMFDMSVPIMVRGEHWGGFRVGYSLA